MFSNGELNEYVRAVVNSEMLESEIHRIRNLMVGLHKYPLPNKAEQKRDARNMEQLFKALLLAKDLREKAVHKVGDNNRGNA